MIRCDKKIDNPCYFYVKSGEKGVPGFCKRPSEFRCIEMVAHCTPQLSYSTVRDWCDCRWKYWLKHVKGITLRPETKSIALKMGTIWDAVMGQGFRSGSWDLVTIGNTIREQAAMMLMGEDEARDIEKLYALAKALSVMEYTPPVMDAQAHLEVYVPDTLYFHGYTDGLMQDDATIVECKLSGSPDYYTTLFNIHDQVGSYFLGNPKMERCVMMVTRPPMLKTLKRRDDETPEEYGNRCQSDILARPSHYFIGWDRERHTWGKTFYRPEFDVDALKRKYEHIAYEIRDAAKRNAFYQERGSCKYPFECDYLSVCETGSMSELRYYIREDKEEQE